MRLITKRREYFYKSFQIFLSHNNRGMMVEKKSKRKFFFQIFFNSFITILRVKYSKKKRKIDNRIT